MAYDKLTCSPVEFPLGVLWRLIWMQQCFTHFNFSVILFLEKKQILNILFSAISVLIISTRSFSRWNVFLPLVWNCKNWFLLLVSEYVFFAKQMWEMLSSLNLNTTRNIYVNMEQHDCHQRREEKVEARSNIKSVSETTSILHRGCHA